MDGKARDFQITCIESHLHQALALMRALDETDREACKATFTGEFAQQELELARAQTEKRR
jgi:hypothetical protein